MTAARQFCFCALLCVLTAGTAGAGPEASVVPVVGEHGIGCAILCDTSGLFLTDAQLVVGTVAPRVELGPQLQITADVVVDDPDHGLAVLWVNPARIAGIPVVAPAVVSRDGHVLSSGAGVRGVTARVRGEAPAATGTVRRVRDDRVETNLPYRLAEFGGALLDDAGDLAGILRAGGPGPGAMAIPVDRGAALLAAAAESIRGWPAPSPRALPPLPAEPFPSRELRQLGSQSDRDVRDFQIVTGRYTVSVLTPPQCFALESRDSASGRWFLSGAYGAEYPPVVAVHVEPRKGSSTILWPIGAVARVGRGAARVLGSIVGTVADGITSSDPRPGRSTGPADHCGVEVVRDGKLEAPLVCQCSGQVYDAKRGVFVFKKKSRAVFFYYPWSVFETRTARPPTIELTLSEPGDPEDQDHIRVPSKLLQLVDADLEPLSRAQGARRVAPVADRSRGMEGIPALLLIRLKGGTVLRAAEAEAWGPRDVRILLEARERIFIPREEIRSITDESGRDWTAILLPEEGPPKPPRGRRDG